VSKSIRVGHCLAETAVHSSGLVRMEFDFFARGFVIGFSIAMPVGPIGVLCIRRTIEEGRAYGLVSGLGAAAADALYGSVAAFGLTAVSSLLTNQQMWFRFIGGLLLLGLGARTFMAKPATRGAPAPGSGLTAAFISTFVLTLTNPATILSFAIVFAGIGLGATDKNGLAGLWLVLGVFVGSACWWLVLSTGVSLVRERFDLRRRQWVNRISGVIIVAFGLLALWSVWK
jgi:threonine/homoserine/homoserine lactone efflux protein